MVNSLPLSINSDAFENLKIDFDDMLMRTIVNMNSKCAEQGSISIKLNIYLERNDDGTVIKPTFQHSVSSAVSIKDKVVGEVTGDYEMVWDDTAGNYALKSLNEPIFA